MVRTYIMHVIMVNLVIMQLGEHVDSTVYLDLLVMNQFHSSQNVYIL